MRLAKIVPIVLRHRGDRTNVLVFEHPLAGTQLVKGTVDAGESLSSALPDAWQYRTEADGGHIFAFRWHHVADPAPSSCHPIFRHALDFLRERLAATLNA